MGLSVSAAAAIFAIGFVLTAVVLVDSLTHTYQELDDASEDRIERQRRLLDTQFGIDSAVYNTSFQTLRIIATNTGMASIDLSKLDIVVDGFLLSGNITSTTVEDAPATVWFPGKALTVQVDTPQKPSRVMLVTDNGVGALTMDIT